MKHPQRYLPAALTTLVLALAAAGGCGIKGSPQPPVREPPPAQTPPRPPDADPTQRGPFEPAPPPDGGT